MTATFFMVATIKKIKIMSEDQLQAKIFQYHWNTYPKERGRLFHINQKSRNSIEGNRMKAMGVIPGISDMCFLGSNGAVYWLELKTLEGRQSQGQISWQSTCEALGHTYLIIRSLEEFLEWHTKLGK
jgi:hypothetical protein